MATKKVQVGIQVDKKGATRGYKQFSKDVQAANKQIRAEMQKTKAASAGLGVGIKGLIGAAGGLFVFHKVNQLFKESIALAGEQASAVAKVEQTIISTGSAAGVTSEELQKMAQEFQNVTTFGDEVILRGQSMLLTFKQIGKDVFPAATEAMLNLSVAMGTDVKESAIQLGKALNDPTTGLTALRRVGITFSKEQENIIKNFQRTGDIASAQKLILQELESQFGGLAKAVALTGEGPLIQFQNIVGDVKESLGEALIPVLLEVTGEFKTFLTEGLKTGELQKTFQGIANGARVLWAVISDAWRGIRAIFKLWAAGWLKIAEAAFATVAAVTGALGKLNAVLGADKSAQKNAETAKSFREMAAAAKEASSELFQEGLFSVEGGSKIVATFKKLSQGTKQVKEELKEIKGAGGLGDVTGGEGGDPKAAERERKKKEREEKAAAAARERQLKERQAFIESESQKFEEALRIREEFRRMGLSQMDQDLLAFQDDLKAKNALLREAGLEEIDIVQMVIDKRNELEEEGKATREQILNDSLSATESIFSAMGRLAQVRAQNELKMAKAAGAGEAQIEAIRKKAFDRQKRFSLLSAIVNTAQAVTSGLATQPFIPLGIIAAAAAAAAGAIQIAAISAQKFQHGGIVGDGQASGDTVPVLANRGEVILNPSQQRNLLALANGRGGNRETKISFGDTIINADGGDPDAIATAVNRTRQEQIHEAAILLRERDALQVN